MNNQQKLKNKLSYNKLTGVFKYKNQCGLMIAGDIAGTPSNGYIQIRFNGKVERAHRLAWLYVYGIEPKHQIDHINHIRSDNRIINLRIVTNSENAKNKSITSKNKSGIVGVFRDEVNNKWKAQIKVDGKVINLGRYRDLFSACCARMSANIKYDFHPMHGKA